MSSVDLGDPVTRTLTVQVLGGLADPTTITFTYRDPLGADTVITPTRTSVGLFSAQFTPTIAGYYRYRWLTTGVGAGSESGSVQVRDPWLEVVSLDDLHAHLNIPTSDTSHDDELRSFADAALATITYINGPLTPTTFTEVRNGGSPVIMLDNPPVISITSVTEFYIPSGQPLTLQPLGASTSAYGYSLDDPAAGKLVRRTSGGYESSFIGGRNSVVITYVAGAQLAPDVQLAMLEDIRGLYQQTQQGGRASLGGGAIGAGGDDQFSVGPMRLFPRLAELLAGPDRTQSIA